MKIHVGCGSVYLEGYVNVDVQSPKTFLSILRPDLVQKWKTTEDNYYGRHNDKTMDALRSGPLDQEYVCDAYGTFDNLPGQTWQIEEVLTRHCFEHLSINEARRALDEIDRKMKPGGCLRIDVPDHEETLKKFKETGDEFYIRHLLGPRRNEYGYHMMSYTRDRLIKLVEEYGFVLEAEEPNIHFYPAFCLRFRKPTSQPAHVYAKPPYEIDPSWYMVEVGPGAFPHPRANLYVDVSGNHLTNIPKNRHFEILTQDLLAGLPSLADKQADYIYCSHVLEHLDFPEAGARILSRVGKRGTVVLPSVFKESLFLFEEADHKWLILPPDSPGQPIRFLRRNPEYLSKLLDVDVTKIMSRLLRTGPNFISRDQRILRKWFYKNEPNLDVIVHWEGSLQIEIL